MKVILVSPPNSFSSGKPSPSLTLAVLSACLKSQSIDCMCIDCNFLPGFNGSSFMEGDEIYERQILNECLDIIVHHDPNVLGISVWGVSVPFAIILSQAVKQNLPQVPIILGGVQDRFLAKKILKHTSQINAVVVGEGELPILEIIERMKSNRDFNGIKGVIYQDQAKIYTQLPGMLLPPQQWLKPDYSSFLLPFGNTCYVEGSRGCSFKCVFCSMNSYPLRRRNPIEVAREIIDLKKERGFEYILFADNFVPLAGDWIEKLCNVLIKMELNIKWSCLSRVDNVSPSTVKKMAASGCEGMFLGVESVSYDTLKYINKSLSVLNYLSNLMDNIQVLRDNDIKLRVSTIIGFPFEGIGDIQRTVDFVLHLREEGIDANTGPVVVYPGSFMWNMYKKGQIKLRKIINPKIRRNCAGLFASLFEDIAYFVPNNFLPEHKFLRQEELESVIEEGIRLIHGQ